MRQDFLGLRPDNLSTYLAGLGLLRALNQIDRSARSSWAPGFLRVDTSADVMDHLLHTYSPTPVLSPWNNGSGYGEKDQAPKVALEKLVTSGATRLSALARTHDVAVRVIERRTSWGKGRLVQELRNLVPDQALDWLDAAVVLTSGDPMFPPLLGTGGNDGRFDFSTNFHQRLIEVLPELGAKTPTSSRWLSDTLHGTQQAPLAKAAVGQFDALAAGTPGTHAFGSADSLVNPWTFVLMVEGMVAFAASPAKRLGEAGARASIPFTVRQSAEGPIPGASDEDSRGEVWCPIWSEWLTESQRRHVFAQGKASWTGRTAMNSAQMYAAAHSGGVDRRINAFMRYGFPQRNGLSYVAALLDRVAVGPTPGIDLSIPIARHADGLRADRASVRLQRARRDYEAAMHRFQSSAVPNARGLLDVLATVTDLHVGFLTSESARANVTRTGLKPEMTPRLWAFLGEELAASPELRIGASLASTFVRVSADRRIPLPELVIGSPPVRGDGWQQPAVRGFGQRRLVEVLGDAAVWVDQQPLSGQLVGRGFQLYETHLCPCDWRDTHAWAASRLDDSQVEWAFKAFSALGWRLGLQRLDGIESCEALPSSLALLAPFAAGAVVRGSGDASSPDDRLGLTRGWAARLRAGRGEQVIGEASALLNRSRVAAGPLRRQLGGQSEPAAQSQAPAFSAIRPITSSGSFCTPNQSTRFLAALWLPHSGAPFWKIASRHS